MLRKGDAFRAKVNVFRNDVDDYINITFLDFGQVGQAALFALNVVPGPFWTARSTRTSPGPASRASNSRASTTPGSGSWAWRAATSAGRNVDTGDPLAKIPPDSITTTVGARFLDNKLTLAARWQAVDAKRLSEIPLSAGQPTFPPTDAYNLVNLYANYKVHEDVMLSASIENLLNEQYARYLTAFPDPRGSSFPPIAMPSPGITIKGALKVRFGEDWFKKG